MSEDPRMVAGVDLLGRTGAHGFTIRFSDDEAPVIWMAAASWERDGGLHWEADAALTPLHAVMRLCERVIDGGLCTHCGRPTIFVDSPDTLGMESAGCVYAYDPELLTFRRDCEGSDR